MTHKNAYIVFENLYSKKLNFDLAKYLKPYKFKLGADVRIALHKGVFRHEFQERYCKEVFQISKRYKCNGVALYKVNDCNKSLFYAPELTVVRQNDRNKIKLTKFMMKKCVCFSNFGGVKVQRVDSKAVNKCCVILCNVIIIMQELNNISSFTIVW